jgi:hypothetical protein
MKKRTNKTLMNIAGIATAISVIATIVIFILNGGDLRIQPYIIPLSGFFLGLISLIRLSNIPVEDDDNSIPSKIVNDTSSPEPEEEEENYPILQDPFTIEVGTVKKTSYEDEDHDWTLNIRYCGTLNDRFILTASLCDEDVESKPSFFPMPDLADKASSGKETIVRISDLDGYTITIKVYEITPTHITLQVVKLEEDEE